MTYNPNIPVSTISPLTQVTDVQTNFASFQTVFGQNHSTLSTTDPNQGGHTSVVLTEQSSAPGVTQDLDCLFCMNNTQMSASQPQLFVQIPNFLPTGLDTSKPGNPPMCLTYQQVNVTGPNQYQSFVAGNYLIFWGILSTQANFLPYTITISPSPTKILSVIANTNNTHNFGSGGTHAIDATAIPVTANTFSINSAFAVQLGTSTVTFPWMAVCLA